LTGLRRGGVSRFTADQVRRYGVKDENLTVIPNAIECDNFSGRNDRQADRTALGWSSNDL